MKGALSSSKTLVLARATWHNIPEDAILHFRSLHNSYAGMFDKMEIKNKKP
jgi:hypothetical protein